jgi:hypothetical protein
MKLAIANTHNMNIGFARIKTKVKGSEDDWYGIHKPTRNYFSIITDKFEKTAK